VISRSQHSAFKWVNLYRYVEDNKSLGNFRLDGIPSAPRGVPQIEVKFDIDANGILSVSAADKGTGKVADIKITGASTLSEDEVERMVKDAEANAAADAEQRDSVDTKNSADSMCYQTEKQLKELDDKIPEDVKEKVNAKLGELRAAIEADDIAGMKEKQEALQQEVMAMGQAMYQGGEGGGGGDGGAGGPPPPGAGAAAPDDVIDAEFSSDK
jgi:heat shock protein 1/8